MENSVSNTALADAMANLLVAATEAATAGHQFSRDFEATRGRIHLDRLERQRRWEHLRAERLSQPIEAS